VALGGETHVEPSLWLILSTFLWLVLLLVIAVAVLVLAIRVVRLVIRRRS